MPRYYVRAAYKSKFGQWLAAFIPLGNVIPLNEAEAQARVEDTSFEACPVSEGGGTPAWADVTGKPTTFAPVIGTGAGDAVAGNDARLTDSRTPTTHTHAPGDVTGTAVVTADSRLNDARTPVAHVHAATDVTGTAVITTDSRLSDARAPTAHTHPASAISDASTAGRSVLTAADAAAQRTALGLGTGAVLNASGSNTGDQTITLTGDVTGSGIGSFAATIAAKAVTLAKMNDMATASVLYRKTAGTGVPEVQPLATLKTDLALVKSDVGLGSVDNTTDAGKPVSTAQQTALDLKANLASPALTGTPAIAAATGTSLAVTGALTSSGGGVGYAAGAGGTVTQLTSRTTGVTLSKLSGTITTNTASLAALAAATFTVTNTLVAIGDVIVVSKRSGSTNVKTDIRVTTVASGSFNITVHNIDAATAEVGAIIINFAILKAVTA